MTIKDICRLYPFFIGQGSQFHTGLLAFSRKQIMNPSPVNLNEVIKIVERLLFRIIGEDIQLRTSFRERLGCHGRPCSDRAGVDEPCNECTGCDV